MQPISLYLDLEKGEHPDLEVVGRATIAFSQLVKEVAFIADPSLIVRLDHESSTEGSLNVHSTIRFITDRIKDPVTRKAIAVAVILWFVQETGSALYSLVFDYIVGEEPEISEQDADKVARRVVTLLEGGAGKPQAQRVYRELDTDTRVVGVGVTTQKEGRPRSIVPRAEFPARGGYRDTEELTESKRTHFEQRTLTLISPVLALNKQKWRFQSDRGKVSASVNDQDFLVKVLTGQLPIPMRAGIEMDVLLEVREEKIDGVWAIKEQMIETVYSVYPEAKTLDLFTGNGEDEE